jgi:hypothetical protein
MKEINKMTMESRRSRPERDYSSITIKSGQGLIMMNKKQDDFIESVMHNARIE